MSRPPNTVVDERKPLSPELVQRFVAFEKAFLDGLLPIASAPDATKTCAHWLSRIDGARTSALASAQLAEPEARAAFAFYTNYLQKQRRLADAQANYLNASGEPGVKAELEQARQGYDHLVSSQSAEVIAALERFRVAQWQQLRSVTALIAMRLWTLTDCGRGGGWYEFLPYGHEAGGAAGQESSP